MHTFYTGKQFGLCDIKFCKLATFSLEETYRLQCDVIVNLELDLGLSYTKENQYKLEENHTGNRFGFVV